MKYTIKQPDGSEITLYHDPLLVRYNGGEIGGDWPAKPAGSSTWTRVADVLGVQQPPPQIESAVEGAATSPGLSGGIAAAVMRRYQDAFLVARATTAIGAAVKVVGIALGILIAVVALVIGSQVGPEQSLRFFAGGVVLGVVVAIPLYVLGILVSAQGQVLKATLDTAVHSSPFLKKEEMMRAMSL